ncbi:hypothetical protein SISSUDRAFT_1038636 [Sistotremastrum suecicum HHB10207 ss-3]|uniref:Uncharacterized protein n=1 Tax=Sistotremastrum suecicum HHB10207 ss-3 TaxID=1314776 RepID=A0A165WHZ9_9AGAM|nr:hypothetical protein SISSUDRAFT_1038636 [Sistotremastrum suecicum HHB10207 ss-3]
MSGSSRSSRNLSRNRYRTSSECGGYGKVAEKTVTWQADVVDLSPMSLEHTSNASTHTPIIKSFTLNRPAPAESHYCLLRPTSNNDETRRPKNLVQAIVEIGEKTQHEGHEGSLDNGNGEIVLLWYGEFKFFVCFLIIYRRIESIKDRKVASYLT